MMIYYTWYTWLLTGKWYQALSDIYCISINSWNNLKMPCQFNYRNLVYHAALLEKRWVSHESPSIATVLRIDDDTMMVLEHVLCALGDPRAYFWYKNLFPQLSSDFELKCKPMLLTADAGRQLLLKVPCILPDSWVAFTSDASETFSSSQSLRRHLNTSIDIPRLWL